MKAASVADKRRNVVIINKNSKEEVRESMAKNQISTSKIFIHMFGIMVRT
jgi:hypothetical protein